MIKSIKIVCLSVAILLSLCGALGAEGGTVVVPARLTKNGLWLVKVSVNGTPAWMLLDTGASTSTLNSRCWHLPILYYGECTVNAWHGAQHERIAYVSTNNILIGDTDFHVVALQSKNLSSLEFSLHERIDGILGSDLLSRCGRISLDYQKRVIVLEK